MIIVDHHDKDSVHTLVHGSESRLQIPKSLTTLTFISLTVSIPLLAFALAHLDVSHEQSIPTIVTFVISIPFYISACFILCNQKLFRRMPSKAINIIYAILLQALWAFSAIESGLVLADKWESLLICAESGIKARDNSTTDWFWPPCVEETPPRVTLLISTLLASAEVVILGLIVKIIAKWDIEASSSSGEPASFNQGILPWTLRFIVPLAYASIGFSVSPLVTVLIHPMIPATYPYLITTVFAGTLTVILHGMSLFYFHRTKPISPPKDRCTVYPTLIFVLILLWLSSTVVGVRKMPDHSFWDGVCYLWETFRQCKPRVMPRFIICLIWSSLQILTLGGMLYIFATRPCTSTLETPAHGEPNVKGPTIAQRQDA